MLRGNFLVGIGYKGLRFKEGDGIKDDRGIVESIEDKVTQDVDLSEVCLFLSRCGYRDGQLMISGNRDLVYKGGSNYTITFLIFEGVDLY